MFLKLNKAVFALLVALVMFGCREYNLYRYEPVTLDILGGSLVVAAEGSYGQNYSYDGKEYADFSNPYTLLFMLSMPYEHDIAGLRITNIDLTGDESGKTISLEDTQSDRVNDPRKRTDPKAEARTVIAAVGGLTSEKFSYESYVLTATVVVLGKDGTEKKEEISVLLKTSFTKQKRSDWFDKYMSV
ncbi:MAG: hypothetical protein H6978_08315 [Gammaproteobacteria bacterium]|nr:hypothetical protein [Gammaproteobacteria bacterium]